MTKKCVLILTLFIFGSLLAADNYVISQQGFFRMRGVNQGYTLDRDSVNSIREFSIPIEFYWPISRETSLYLYTSHASVNGANMASLSGLSDTQISWNYYLEDKHLIFNAGLGLPTGKTTLNPDEFSTSVLISQHYWNFNVPSFGQGFNLSPGVTWAAPLSDATVIGLGMAFQIRGGFIPMKDTQNVYKPGNEILLTCGVDLRLATLSTFAWDFIFSSYGSDTYADTLDVYKSGNKIVTNAQFKTYFGYDVLSLSIRYRSKAKSQIINSDTSGTYKLIAEREKSYPNQVEFSGQYKHRHSASFFMSYGLEGKFYEELVFAGLNLMGISVMPELKMSEKSQLFGQLKYWTGKYGTDVPLSGLEVGIGFMYMF